MLHGNLAVPTGTNPSHELLAFYDSTVYSPNLPSNSVFLTSCSTGTMYSSSCPPSVNIYNLLGQLINVYNRPTDTLATQSYKNNTKWANFFMQGNF